MAVRLKKLDQQVMVITGASSGIGLATARLAAGRGAKLVLAARNENSLRQLTDEIRGGGGEAAYVAADVGDEEAVGRIARTAVERFGGFDTWVNNAGVSIYGEMLKVSTADHRKIFETNFWGFVYGSLAAARHFRDRGGDTAGALINVGSIVGDQAVPVQGMYSASKFAVKGFTDALRMELEHADVPVSVTLVKPSGIDTPFPQNAKNYMDREPTLPPPIYEPRLVGETILHCAEHPQRDVTVGEGKFTALTGQFAPRLADHVIGATMPAMQKTDRRPERHGNNLHGAGDGGLKERGKYEGMVFRHSPTTWASLHPLTAVTLAVGAGLVLAAAGGAAMDGRRA